MLRRGRSDGAVNSGDVAAKGETMQEMDAYRASSACKELFTFSMLFS